MTDLITLDFLRHALEASLLIGLMLSLMGIFVVMRRIVFVGAALAQTSAAGAALGLLLGLHAEWVAMAVTLAGVALMSVRPRRVAMPSEGAIGLGYALASSLAILLIARAPGGEADTLLLFYGNILAIQPRELTHLLILCPALLTTHALFKREFLLVSFNPETARAAGVRVWLWNLLLYVTLGLGISAGIHIAGSLLTFSFLVLPALAGLMLARRIWHVAALAVASSVAGSVLGILASVHWDLPTGPCIVAVLAAEVAAAWVLARITG